MEEEESGKRKANASESGGDSKAGASSSGPATSEEEAPRSRGGVPTTADSGDSISEIAKRKIGDSEQGVSEDPKDDKNKTGKEEEKGAKRSTGEREEFARRIKNGAEEIAEESKNRGGGVDINRFDVARGSEQCTCVSQTRSSTRRCLSSSTARGESMRRTCITTRLWAR